MRIRRPGGHDKQGGDGADQAVAVSFLRARDERVLLIDVLRVGELVAMRQECWQEAAQTLQEALTLAQTIGASYGEAKTLYVAGQFHALLGASELARERFSAALTICVRLGERLYASFPLVGRSCDLRWQGWSKSGYNLPRREGSDAQSAEL